MLCAAVVSLIDMPPGGTAMAAEGMVHSGVVRVETVQVYGLVHTIEETILKLLPRQIPAEFNRAEIDEFERRIRNLSLFDRVSVALQDRDLMVEVLEKYTLAPILNFTSGSVLQDLNATVGLVEYNLGGTGTQLGGQLNYSQRGLNVDVWLSQHSFQPTRWAKEAKASYNVNGIRFADSTAAWNRNRIGGELELKGPYAYGSPLRYEVVLKFYR
jgi:outer membrane protein assembly factor BamA